MHHSLPTKPTHDLPQLAFTGHYDGKYIYGRSFVLILLFPRLYDTQRESEVVAAKAGTDAKPCNVDTAFKSIECAAGPLDMHSKYVAKKPQMQLRHAKRVPHCI